MAARSLAASVAQRVLSKALLASGMETAARMETTATTSSISIRVNPRES